MTNDVLTIIAVIAMIGLLIATPNIIELVNIIKHFFIKRNKKKK